MTNKRWWPTLGLAAVTLALAGCGNGSDNTTSVRVANATLTHSSIALLVNGASSVATDAMDTISGYVTPSSGSVALQVNDATTSAALATSVPTLAAGGHYTLLAYESAGVVQTALLTEDTVVPATGVTTLRVYDAAPGAGKLDIYVSSTVGSAACSSSDLASISPATSFGLLTAAGASYLTEAAGSYTLCVTGSGSKTDLRMALPMTLTSATVATAVLTPATGGSLLNGSLVVQQGAYTAARNTNTRVRLAASLSGGGTVAVSSSSGKVVDAGSSSPVFDFGYTLVPAADSLNITVDSASVASPVSTLTAYQGQDLTLLVTGTGAAPVVSSPIVDTNSVPTDQTTVNIRVINGLTTALGNVTLTANNTALGVSVPPATAGNYTVLPGSSSNSSFAVNFVLNASQVTGSLPLATNVATQTLNVATTYTILVGGADASGNYQLLIR